MMLRLLIAALAVSALTSTAMARVLEPVPVPLPAPFPPVQIGEEHAGDCEEVYINQAVQTGYYYAPGPNLQLADDLHTTATSDWPLCAVDFGYYEPVAGPDMSATIRIYRNDGSDSGFGPIIAGPFVVGGLARGGAYAYHVELPSGVVGPDVWMSVAFSSGSAGLLTYDPPSTGGSHDVDAEPPTIYQSPYGGVPPANYFLGVYASRPTGTENATWGRVKSFYR